MANLEFDADRIRVEAIREFAEELKACTETEYYRDVETGSTFIYRTVTVEDIDRLADEMVKSPTREEQQYDS